MIKPIDTDAYIASFPADIQKLLQEVRATIKTAAPEAVEVISYAMPAFKQNGMLVWFAAHTSHIGFYPGGSGITAFQKEIAQYKNSKGAVQFPFNEPIPHDLITQMVEFKIAENEHKLKLKKK